MRYCTGRRKTKMKWQNLQANLRAGEYSEQEIHRDIIATESRSPFKYPYRTRKMPRHACHHVMWRRFTTLSGRALRASSTLSNFQQLARYPFFALCPLRAPAIYHHGGEAAVDNAARGWSAWRAFSRPFDVGTEGENSMLLCGTILSCYI